MSIHGFMDQNGQVQKYDYNDLDNKPTIPVIDATLTQQGQAADAAAVGEALQNVQVPVDATLTEEGQAADAAAVGEAIANVTIPIDDELSNSSTNPVQNKVVNEAILSNGFSLEAKRAFAALCEHFSYSDPYAYPYYIALYNALHIEEKTLSRISVTFTQGDTVIYTTDDLEDLKSKITLYAYYADGSRALIKYYTLSGRLLEGTSTITASYGGKNATFSVTVTAQEGVYTIVNNLSNCRTTNLDELIDENETYAANIIENPGYILTGATVSITMGGTDITSTAYSDGVIAIAEVTGNLVISVSAAIMPLSFITAVFNQGQAVIYNADSLETLRQYLTVTATYIDTSTKVITDYTLSGKLTVGTSTITASYGGESDTFEVTVTYIDNSIYNWDFTQSLVDSKQGVTAVLGGNITQSSNGLTWTGTNGIAKLVNLIDLQGTRFTIEIDATTVKSFSDADNRFINFTKTSSFTPDGGFWWRNGQWRWRDSSGTYYFDTASQITSSYFNGKTLKIQIDQVSGNVYFYVDDILIQSFSGTSKSFGTTSSKPMFSLGASSGGTSLQSGSVIRAVRIYPGLV